MAQGLGLQGAYGLAAAYKSLADLKAESERQQALREQAAATKLNQEIQIRQLTNAEDTADRNARNTDRTFDAAQKAQAFQEAHITRTDAATAAETKRKQDLEDIDRALKAGDRDEVQRIIARMPPGPQRTVIELRARGGPTVAADELRTAEERGAEGAKERFSAWTGGDRGIALDKSAMSIDEAMAKQRAQEAQVNLEDAREAAETIVAHKMAPSQAASFYGGMGGGSAAFKRAVAAGVKKLAPDFDWEAAESNYAFGKSVGNQSMVRMIDNIALSIPDLRKASEDFDRTGWTAMNEFLIATKHQVGDTPLATFKAFKFGVADEIAKILTNTTGGATSDFKLKQASDQIELATSKEALSAGLDALEKLLQIRRTSITRGTFMEEGREGGPPEREGAAAPTGPLGSIDNPLTFDPFRAGR